MWWKIYFWFMLFLGVIGVLAYAAMFPWSPMETFEVGLSVVLLIGLYSYVYKKPLWNKSFWRITFWLYVAWTLFVFLDLYISLRSNISGMFVSRLSMDGDGAALVLGTVFSLPEFYAAYQLSLQKKTKASSASKKKKK